MSKIDLLSQDKIIYTICIDTGELGEFVRSKEGYSIFLNEYNLDSDFWPKPLLIHDYNLYYVNPFKDDECNVSSFIYSKKDSLMNCKYYKNYYDSDTFKIGNYKIYFDDSYININSFQFVFPYDFEQTKSDFEILQLNDGNIWINNEIADYNCLFNEVNKTFLCDEINKMDLLRCNYDSLANDIIINNFKNKKNTKLMCYIDEANSKLFFVHFDIESCCYRIFEIR